MATALPREGVLIPGFELPRSDGGTLRLRSFRGRRSLLVYFAHGAGCAACRAFLAGALEGYAAYAEEGAEVLAIVPDMAEAVAALQSELALPFPVLVDAEGTVCRRYGLTPAAEAAVAVTDRYGEPRRWQPAGPAHELPDHDDLIAELRYLGLTCSGGCSAPLWGET